MPLKCFLFALDSAVKVGRLLGCLLKIATSFGDVDLTQRNIEVVENTHSINGLINL